jgi:hypothetical protein
MSGRRVAEAKCFVAEITPGFSEQYCLQKQYVPPRQTGEAIAVRRTKVENPGETQGWHRTGRDGLLSCKSS